MIDICIIGNSHAGSLKRAWDEIGSRFPEIRITFFAQRAKGLSELLVENNKLVTKSAGLARALRFTSGGKDEIDVNEYDQFIIYGLGAKPVFFDKDSFFSKAVILTSMNDLVQGTLSFVILNQLRKITEKAIFIGHNPLLAEKNILFTEYPEKYIDGIKHINEIIYEPLKTELVAQPIKTIINGRATHADFTKASKRLAIGDAVDEETHLKHDNAHMNDKFGEIWLNEFFKKYLSIKGY